MRRDSSKQFIRHSIQILGTTLPVFALLFLAGCGQNGMGKPSFTQPPQQVVTIPPEILAQKELLDPAGLATLPRTNPFKNLLSPDEGLGALGDAAALPPPPPPDPFAGFVLNGIVYRDKKSQAILTSPHGKARIIRLGDTLSTPADPSVEIKVTQISKNDITLQVTNPPGNYPPDYKTRTLKIASLIGYTGKFKTSKTQTSSEGATQTEPHSESKIPTEVENMLGGQQVNKINAAFNGNGNTANPQQPSAAQTKGTSN